MRNLFFYLLLIGSTLSGQELDLGPLAWLNSDDAPDTLPVPKGLPSFFLSDQQRTVLEPGYVEYHLSVSADGEAWALVAGAGSPWLDKQLPALPRKFTAAKRAGAAVVSEVAMFVIYNPASASSKGADATPRLLEVQPPLYPEGKEESVREVIVRVQAELDTTGRVVSAKALEAVDDDFASAACGVLRLWKFAPARRSGDPVAASVELNVVFLKPRVVTVGKVAKIPQTIFKREPMYPPSLRRAGFSGEVVLEMVITTEGRVVAPFVVRSSHRALEDSALEAIRQWRFRPAEMDGKPVACRVAQLFQFSVDADASGKNLYGFKVNVPKTWPPNLPEQLRFEVAPELDYMEPPVYPFEDLVAKRGGKATVAYVVDTTGKVSEATALPGATTEAMAAAAVAATEKFRFRPAGRQGKPCHAMLRIEFEFSPDGLSGHVPVPTVSKRILQLLEKSEPRLIKASELDQVPKLRSSPALNQSTRKGRALLEFVVDADGVPRVPRVVSATDPIVGAAAVQVVNNWRFYRPIQHGRYVDTLVRMPIDFK